MTIDKNKEKSHLTCKACVIRLVCVYIYICNNLCALVFSLMYI